MHRMFEEQQLIYRDFDAIAIVTSLGFLYQRQPHKRSVVWQRNLRKFKIFHLHLFFIIVVKER